MNKLILAFVVTVIGSGGIILMLNDISIGNFIFGVWIGFISYFTVINIKL